MLTSKQRAKLKSIATTTESILQVGKGGIGEQLIIQVNDALEARELIKLHVLETAPQPTGELAAQLAEATKSEVVQIIGRRVVLFRRNNKNPQIELSDKPAKKAKKVVIVSKAAKERMKAQAAKEAREAARKSRNFRRKG